MPQRDPAALASALQRLLTNRELCLRLASRGRRLIEEEFNIHRTTERRRSLFRAAIAGFRGPECQVNHTTDAPRSLAAALVAQETA